MKALTQREIGLVCGGDGVTNSEADKVIGGFLGSVWHGLSSKEAVFGMALGPNGMIAGAIIHFKLNH